MKLKLDEKGNVVVQDGKPVYLKDDGSEVPFDVAGTLATISRLNGESKSHRERAEAAETQLKNFAGIDDPEFAKQSMQTMKNIDAKKLIDAGEVEKVKGEIAKAYQSQIDEYKAQAETFQKQLHGEIVGGSFARSKFIGEKVAIPVDLVQAKFGSHFAVEDGKLVAKDQNGNKIYSPSNPGELAGFDEALEHLVKQAPYANQILKGSGASGSGAGSNSNPGSGGKPTITRADFSKLDPVAQANFARQKDAQITE